MIQFSKVNKVFPFISLAIIIAIFAITYFVLGGFNKGIDFTSGLDLRLRASNAIEVEEIRSTLKDSHEGISIQGIGDEGLDFSIRLPVLDSESSETVSNQIKTTLEENFEATFLIVSSNFVGARFATELNKNILLLVFLTLALILLYITVRFKFMYGVGAIAALVHDVLFLVGLNGLFQLEISSVTIAAVLTIIGYSLNDTVVIFDRIRENTKEGIAGSFSHLVDISVNQTLSRTLVTSLTTLIAVIPLYLLSEGAPKLFALNLILGIIIGTYSSIFIANPTLVSLRKRAEAKLALKYEHAQSEKQSSAPHTVVKKVENKITPKQTAEEIRLATETKARRKEEKRKKAKKKK